MSASATPERRGPWGLGPNPTREQIAQRQEESNALCLEYVKTHAERGNAASVVQAIDEFAKDHHVMNIGTVKGEIIDEEIRKKQPAVIAELGGFTGYSAVRFANVQREAAGGKPSHYYSFEFSPVYAARIREVVEFAGLSDQVTVFEGPFAERYHELDGKTVDIYFIDHDKQAYLTDAKLIVESGTLVPGSLLVADNVLHTAEYVEFVEKNPQFSAVMHNVLFGREAKPVPDLSIATFLG